MLSDSSWYVHYVVDDRCTFVIEHFVMLLSPLDITHDTAPRIQLKPKPTIEKDHVS